MRRFLTCLVLAVGCASGETLSVEPPQRGFEQNLGQYSSDVLFALDERVFYANRVQLVPGLTLQFVNSNASAAVSGQNPRAFPLNLYLGSDPKKWLENVPHFTTVRYSQVYPGIDVEFNTDTTSYPGTPFVRIRVRAGANPQQIIMNLFSDPPSSLNVFQNQVAVYGFTLGSLVAYQTEGGSKSAVQIKFVEVNSTSVQLQVTSGYDTSLPLTIEFGSPFCSCLSPPTRNVASDDSIAFSGGPLGIVRHSFIAKSRADGTPSWLSLFDNVQPSWMVSDQKGNMTLAGGFAANISLSAPPVTTDAPLPAPNQFPTPRSATLDVWLGRFDANGRLVSSTYTGDAKAFALDPDGSVYFSTAESVNKWVSGQSRFGFSAPLGNVIALATNQKGELAFAATGSVGQYTTANALNAIYEGPWTEYAGKLDRLSGAILMATYVAIVGSDSTGFNVSTSLALAPGGSLWLASDFAFNSSAVAYTLVAVSGDGARFVDSEALHGSATVSFDAAGNALVVLRTDFPVSPTSPDAGVRVPCSYPRWYYMKRAPDGSLLYASYLNISVFGPIVTFDGPERLFLFEYSGLMRVDLNPPTISEISCLVSPAERTVLNSLARGELVTISGYQLGPLQPVYASFDVAGQLPTQLAGMQVTIGQVAMPLVSLQQGIITFYLPETTPVGTAPLEVYSAGIPIAGTTVSINAASVTFAVFTADGSGTGPVAAINQDGSLNADHGAPGGSVVAIFGIGATPPSYVYLDGATRYYNVSVEYAGPAPGLVPGVKQINLRLPNDFKPPEGSDFARLHISNAIEPLLIRGLH